MVVIRYSQGGKIIEVAGDRYGYGLRKVRGFRYYDSALKFAKELAAEMDCPLEDYVGQARSQIIESDSALTAEEKLWRAVTGEDLSR